MLRRVALVRTDMSDHRHQDDKNRYPSSPIFVTLMMEALRSSETSVIFVVCVHRLLVNC
jgi:hypothetical protein